MSARATAAALAVIVVLTACSHNAASQGKTITGTGPTKITWAACGGEFQCGSVTVPLDYSSPGAGTINIYLIKKPALDARNRIGSVLTNPGGPGESGIDFLRNYSPGLARLNVSFDLIGFDPRGVGESSPVSCFENSQPGTSGDFDPVLDDPVEKQAAIQAVKEFAAACEQHSYRVLPFVDTPSAARDMDEIRKALGDAKLTYLGFSYGTYLGQMYAHLFPTHVRALALDGVADPTLSANDELLGQVAEFEKNLQAFLADCRGSTTCTYAQSGDPGAKLNALMQRLDGAPLRVGSRSLTRAIAMSAVLGPLHDQRAWPDLERALTKADQGDGSALLQLADDFNGRKPDGSYSNFGAANAAINCLDHPVPADVAAFDSLGPAFAQASPFFGPATQYSYLVCAFWAVKATGQPGPLPAPGAPPILLVGGTGDPATPYAWAQSVHHQLARSILLTRIGNGHVSYFVSTCVEQAEDAYLLDLKLPVDGTTCSA